MHTLLKFTRWITRYFNFSQQNSACSQCQKRQWIDADDIWNYGIGDKLLYKQAKLGDVEAQYQVGNALLHGENGFEKNPNRAIEWLRKAAAQGHANAEKILISLD